MLNSYSRTVFAFVATLLLITASTAASQAKTKVAVPDGTQVPVQLTAAVNSGENHIGDIVPLIVASDVVVAGWVIVPAGAKGQGHVTKIDQSGGHGHPGTIEMLCDYVVSADGGKIRLQPTTFTGEGKKTRGGATVAGIFTYGLASNAIRGGDAVINTTRTLSALIAGPIHVVALKKTAAGTSDGFDH